MPDQTIVQETLDNNIVDTDFVVYWKTASSVQRRASRASVVGATLTGAGAIATGGFTLTVPATGTASLLGTAQTYTAAKTFSALITANAGISFGQTTLSFFEESTWTPSGNGVTFSAASGHYQRIGSFVMAAFAITWPTTADGGSALINGLPYTVKNTSPIYLFGGDTISGADYKLAATANTTRITPITPGTINTIPTNATLSGQSMRGYVIYLM